MIRLIKVNSPIRDIEINLEETFSVEYTIQISTKYILIKNSINNGIKLNKYFNKLKEITDYITEIEYSIEGVIVSDDFVDSSSKKTRVLYKVLNDEEVLEIFYKERI